ncbi:MAG: ankyrin repeat domain-containing protein [Treponema sp.]
MKKTIFIAGLLCTLAASVLWADWNGERLMEAVREQNMTNLKHYLAQTDSANYADDTGRSLLMEACSKQWMPGVEKLIEAKANPSFKNSNGQTALMIAVKETNNDNIAKYLIERGEANVNAEDHSGKTVLMYAAENNNYNNLVYLVKNTKVNPGQQDNLGNTALMYAIKNGNIAGAKYLADSTGVNWDQKNSDGKNAFMLAVEKSTQMVRFLFEGNYGLDIDKKVNGMPVLFWAIKTRQSKDVISLIMNNYTPEALLTTTDENGNDIEYYIDLVKDEYARRIFEEKKHFKKVQDEKQAAKRRY